MKITCNERHSPYFLSERTLCLPYPTPSTRHHRSHVFCLFFCSQTRPKLVHASVLPGEKDDRFLASVPILTYLNLIIIQPDLPWDDEKTHTHKTNNSTKSRIASSTSFTRQLLSSRDGAPRVPVKVWCPAGFRTPRYFPPLQCYSLFKTLATGTSPPPPPLPHPNRAHVVIDSKHLAGVTRETLNCS